jgi:hypothetical protein
MPPDSVLIRDEELLRWLVFSVTELLTDSREGHRVSVYTRLKWTYNSVSNRKRGGSRKPQSSWNLSQNPSKISKILTQIRSIENLSWSRWCRSTWLHLWYAWISCRLSSQSLLRLSNRPVPPQGLRLGSTQQEGSPHEPYAPLRMSSWSIVHGSWPHALKSSLTPLWSCHHWRSTGTSTRGWRYYAPPHTHSPCLPHLQILACRSQMMILDAIFLPIPQASP